MQIILALALVLPLRSSPVDDVAILRAEGPGALARLVERYRLLPEGAEKDKLETTIDAAAAQRYASVSGLYWYTDLAAAEAAARADGKPILSLRMLGRLDEELSCANSRFFRVALYANQDVARFLRENFVLHWSSERPVPKVTIDFGDGRAIHTTVAGNSAHYVLDCDGRPLDVLPGLYSPVAFKRELEALLPLARQSPTLTDAERLRRVIEFHGQHDGALASIWAGAGDPVRAGLRWVPGIVPAEARAYSKVAVERPSLVAISLDGGSEVPNVRRVAETELDESSRALFERLIPAGEAGAALANFQRTLAADTERNELEYRRRIHGYFLGLTELPTFEVLNERVYREVFLTPRADAWLGLRATGVFNGLPKGGIGK